MKQAKITAIEQDINGITVIFSDGLGLVFPNADAFKQWVTTIEEPDIAKKFVLAWWVARDADLSNPNLVVGKTLTFDLTNQNPIRVQ